MKATNWHIGYSAPTREVLIHDATGPGGVILIVDAGGEDDNLGRIEFELSPEEARELIERLANWAID